MTARKPRVRVATRPPSRAYARAPEVCSYSGIDDLMYRLHTRLRRRDRLDQTSVAPSHAPTPGARTIQRP
jgi:hypothetical protein